MFSKLLGISRLILFFIVLFLYFSFLFFTNFLFSKEKQVLRGLTTRRFIISNVLNRILGVKISVKGSIPSEKCILMANHRTYYDAIVVLKDVLAFPIGKIEVQSWPLIGYAATLTGVLFVNRSNKESRRGTIDAMIQKLNEGYSIFNTPEGTTHNKPTSIDFHPGTFVVAAKNNIPIVPIAIEYQLVADAWIGDDTFIRHFVQCFGKWNTHIKVTYFDAIISEDADYLIKTTKNLIDNELLSIRKDWKLN